MTQQKNNIGVVGAGAWGVALATSLAQAGRGVILWGRTLPKLAAPQARITPTDRLDDLAVCHALLMVVPTQFLRTVLARLKPVLARPVPLILCCKGVEIATGLLPHQIAREECPDHEIAVLTGPSFAVDVMAGKPVALTLAAETLDVARTLSDQIGSKTLRTYLSTDRVGAEVGGAVKNVMAIACGIITGMGLGESARAALITRGLAEMARLADKMGGTRESLMGLSGAGDMILSCTTQTSRNFSLGLKLGRGQKLNDILAEQKGVTEGLHTAKSIRLLCDRYQVEMPIAGVVHDFLHEGLSLSQAVEQILNRPLREERE